MELTFAYGTSDACSTVTARERSCYKWDKGIAFHYYFENKVPLEVFLWLDSSSLTSVLVDVVALPSFSVFDYYEPTEKAIG